MTHSREHIWSDLAVKAQGGDASAYRQLLGEIAPFVRRVIAKTLPSPDAADDVAQEVLISVHKALATYSPKRPFLPWLMAIVNFRRTDYLRAHYARQGHLQAPPEILDHLEDVTSDGEESESGDKYEKILQAVEELPEKQKEVFRLVKLEGLSTQEAANKTGMSVSAIKVSVHRTIQKLKDRLGQS
jgi:RNA polymerase sigma-70 factor (ECF subfamily)